MFSYIFAAYIRYEDGRFSIEDTDSHCISLPAIFFNIFPPSFPQLSFFIPTEAYIKKGDYALFQPFTSIQSTATMLEFFIDVHSFSPLGKNDEKSVNRTNICTYLYHSLFISNMRIRIFFLFFSLLFQTRALLFNFPGHKYHSFILSIFYNGNIFFMEH